MGEWRRMRWYNPSLGDFEWVEVPASDDEALKLLEGAPDSHRYVGVYQEWRELGAGIMAALIRVGEAAQERQAGSEEGRGGDRGSPNA